MQLIFLKQMASIAGTVVGVLNLQFDLVIIWRVTGV